MSARRSKRVSAPSVERQELHCHGCEQYVQFDVDLALNGNHVLRCPNCDHEHCRVVENGRITDIRWDRRNGPTIYVSSGAVASTIISSYSAYAAGGNSSQFLYVSWMNTGAMS